MHRGKIKVDQKRISRKTVTTSSNTMTGQTGRGTMVVHFLWEEDHGGGY
jgi:hypothetical protein